VRVWDRRQPRVSVAALVGHSYAVSRACFDPADGRHLLSVSFDGAVRLWDARRWAPLALLHDTALPLGCAHKAAFAPDGRALACATARGYMALWDVAACARRAVLFGPPCEMADFAFSPAGDTVVTAYEETAFVWAVPAALRAPGAADAAAVDDDTAWRGERVDWRRELALTRTRLRVSAAPACALGG
jgi:WD40 repeat protein